MSTDKIYKIYLSAGHGFYYNPQWKEWMTQTRSYWGVVEDFWTVLVARELFVLLDEDRRFQVFMNRDFFNEELGISGHQKWMEASSLFFKEIGAPESIYNVDSGIEQAIQADALGASHYQADIAVSIHADSGGGEATGYSVWHHSYANFGRKLAAKIEHALDSLPNTSNGIKCDSVHDKFAFWKANQGRIMALVNYFHHDNRKDNELMKLQSNITLCAQMTYQGIVDFIETYGHQISWIN